MARTTHDRVRDHEGIDLDTNIELDGATTSYADGDVLHAVISDIDDRITASPGFTPVVFYAELNTNVTTTPSSQTDVPFDTFYDIDQNDTSGVLPAGCGLTYSSGVFTATESGIWIINLGVDITAAPGDTGLLTFSVPNYGYNPQLGITASGNTSPWRIERIVVMLVSDTFSFKQFSVSAIDIIDGYAAMDVVRMSGSAI